MKSISTIHIKHLLLTALLAFACSVFLLWFKSNAAIAVTDWNQWKNENLVSCNLNVQPGTNEMDKKQPGKKDSNGCSHQLTGALCQTNHSKRKLKQQRIT